MKKNLFIFCLFFSILFSESAFAIGNPDTCTIGVFVNSIYGLDYIQSSYDADIWVWVLSKQDTINHLENLEVSNAKNFTFSLSTDEVKNGIKWSSQLCKATIKHDWDTRDFPFDHQRLTILIDDANKDISQLVFLPDIKNSKLNKDIKLDGWKILPLGFRTDKTIYETTYGDPVLQGLSIYSTAVAGIDLVRNGIGLFFKLFSGVYISFLIAMLVFFFEPTSDTRYALSVGALFATVANKYIVDSLLPATESFTLVDEVHDITLFVILITIMVSVLTMHLGERGKEKLRIRINHSSAIILFVLYVGWNAYRILSTY